MSYEAMDNSSLHNVGFTGRHPVSRALDKTVFQPAVVAWSSVFIIIRACRILIFYHISHSPGVWLFASSELIALVASGIALATHSLDCSLRGLIVPVLYMLPVLLTPTGNQSEWTGLPLLFVACLQIACRLYMGFHITVGVPTFKSLLQNGPYRYLRHPLATIEILLVVMFTLHCFSLHNVLIAMLCVAGGIWAVHAEESFLMRFADYRMYKKQVPNKFIPSWN